MFELQNKKNTPLKPIKQMGFTLIELLIAIAVIAILAKLGFSSYNNTIQKGYRYQIQQSMVEVSQQLERYYSRNGNYSGSNVIANDYSTSYYSVSSELEDDSYTISAEPISTSGQSNDACGTLTLNSVGTKTPTTSECWK